MHALQGIVGGSNTFTLLLKVGNKLAAALVDSGSDASFMSAKFAAKSQCQIFVVPTVTVVVANGEEYIVNMLAWDASIPFKAINLYLTLD